jgi:hypothetical protein
MASHSNQDQQAANSAADTEQRGACASPHTLLLMLAAELARRLARRDAKEGR